MKLKQYAQLITCVTALFMLPASAAAAEIRGSVNVAYQGLFESQSSSQVHPVSVAALPAQEQRVLRRAPRQHRIEIVNNRMRPAFITVQTGDRVEFVNRDSVYHELFSLSPGESVNERLGKVGSGEQSQVKFTFGHAGTTHFFCRIHNKSYARIDVVETPYLQMVEPGGRFHFVGLAAGKWKLRLASPAAETKWVDVTAMTTPPPLQLELTSRGGNGALSSNSLPSKDIAELFQSRSTKETGR